MNVLGDMLDVKKSKSPASGLSMQAGFSGLGDSGQENNGGFREVNQVLLFTKSCKH